MNAIRCPPLRFAAAVSLILAVPAVARAVSPETCSRITDDAMRLGCFDMAYPRAPEPGPKAPQTYTLTNVVDLALDAGPRLGGEHVAVDGWLMIFGGNYWTVAAEKYGGPKVIVEGQFIPHEEKREAMSHSSNNSCQVRVLGTIGKVSLPAGSVEWGIVADHINPPQPKMPPLPKMGRAAEMNPPIAEAALSDAGRRARHRANETADIPALLAMNEQANDKCRGGRGDSPATMAACDERADTRAGFRSGRFAEVRAPNQW